MRKILTLNAATVSSPLGSTGRVAVSVRADGKAVMTPVQDGGVKLSRRAGRSTATVTVSKAVADAIPTGSVRAVRVLTLDRDADPVYVLKASADAADMVAHTKGS